MIGYDEVRKTYFVQVKYRDPITLKQRTKKKRGFKTKREAKIYEAEAMQQGNDPSDLTFEQVAYQWEEYALPQKSKHADTKLHLNADSPTCINAQSNQSHVHNSLHGVQNSPIATNAEQR